MAKVNITTSKPTPVRRDRVHPGQVFKIKQTDGTLGKKRYACLASNGKFLSLNIDNGQLASTTNGAKQVVVIGTAKLSTARLFGAYDKRRMTRVRVASGQIFENAKGHRFYALGRLNGRNASLAMNKAFSGDYSMGDDHNEVTVVGEAALDVTIAA